MTDLDALGLAEMFLSKGRRVPKVLLRQLPPEDRERLSVTPRRRARRARPASRESDSSWIHYDPSVEHDIDAYARRRASSIVEPDAEPPELRAFILDDERAQLLHRCGCGVMSTVTPCRRCARPLSREAVPVDDAVEAVARAKDRYESEVVAFNAYLERLRGD